MVPVPGSYFRSRVLVHLKDKTGILHSLENFDLLETVVDAVSRGETPRKPWVLSLGDLERMKQIGLRTGRELDFVIEFPWDARSFITIGSKSNDKQLRRRVLVMALDRIRRTSSLRKTFAAKGLPACTVRENPYLAPGHCPYENFIESLLTMTDASTPAGEELFKLFLESAADEADDTALNSVEKRGVRTVFHGTNHAVMDAILSSGLDPSCRRSTLKEDYFGVDYRTSLKYTKRKTVPNPTFCKLLVFMIIVEPAGPLFSSGAGTVASNKFQLPLAEITLDEPW